MLRSLAARSVARADSVVTVPSFFCVAGTQVAFRPAGSTIVIRSRYAEQTRGTLTNFLEAQTTTLSINGGAAIDGTNLYSAPFFVPDSAGTNNGVWEAGFDTPTGNHTHEPRGLAHLSHQAGRFPSRG